MASEQEADVSSEPVPEGEETPNGGAVKQKRLEGLQGMEASSKEPKPQHSCGITTPPPNVKPGARPTPQFQCSVTTPPTNVKPGAK